jgi:cyclase
MIDTGQTPVDSLAVMGVLKKLSAQPARFIIHTEPHDDHTNGDFVFSPPAVVIAHAGAAESMRKANTVERNQKLAGEYPGMGEAMKGYRQVLPNIEYRQKMTLYLGERSFELMVLKNVHSEADTAIWLPRERVLWAAAAVGVKRYPNIRPFLTIPDILASIKLMRALNPEVVIAGHGAPGTTKIFDEMERYYALLLERVGRMAREGKTLESIKAELKMPEFDDWAGKERLPSNVDAAWRAVKGS